LVHDDPVGEHGQVDNRKFNQNFEKKGSIEKIGFNMEIF